jgi:hypothetical protein
MILPLEPLKGCVMAAPVLSDMRERGHDPTG